MTTSGFAVYRRAAVVLIGYDAHVSRHGPRIVRFAQGLHEQEHVRSQEKPHPWNAHQEQQGLMQVRVLFEQAENLVFNALDVLVQLLNALLVQPFRQRGTHNLALQGPQRVFVGRPLAHILFAQIQQRFDLLQNLLFRLPTVQSVGISGGVFCNLKTVYPVVLVSDGRKGPFDFR